MSESQLLFVCVLLTRVQAAHYLGVSPRTLAVWKSTGRYNLPCVRIGRLVKYRQADLDAFIERNTVVAEVA
jgi:excisionase family DNA binding protein